jgi:hypothetical protein
MEKQTKQKTSLFNGAGYLAGFILGTAAAILFVALTGVEALIGAIAASLSIPAGLCFEKMLKGAKPAAHSTWKMLMAFSIFGILLLAVVVGLFV